jgi:hypothetical protein
MAENAYTLGLGRVDVGSTNTKTDVQITLDISGGAAMADPFAGLVPPPSKRLFLMSVPPMDQTRFH